MHTRRMEMIMSLLMRFGMMISVVIVMMGASLYLLHNGKMAMDIDMIQAIHYPGSLSQIWNDALSFSPFGLIELGILILVLTQALRVGLLVWFYALTRDFSFFMLSLFIFTILIYSLFFR